MKIKVVLLGAAGVLGVYGLYKTINNHLDKRRSKREYEIREIESEWHSAGWKGGYAAGKRDAEMDAMIIKRRNEED